LLNCSKGFSEIKSQLNYCNPNGKVTSAYLSFFLTDSVSTSSMKYLGDNSINDDYFLVIQKIKKTIISPAQQISLSLRCFSYSSRCTTSTLIKFLPVLKLVHALLFLTVTLTVLLPIACIGRCCMSTWFYSIWDVSFL
jgi:nitrogen fixation/metabolism regulation signal transduction histidine kinase